MQEGRDPGADSAARVPADAGLPSPLRLLVLTAVCIFVGEFLVMLVLMVLPQMKPLPEALLDATMITALSFPFLYALLFRPMIFLVRAKERAQQDLRQLNEGLEHRVADRTKELRAANKRLRVQIEARQRAQDDAWRGEEFSRSIIESVPCLVFIYEPSRRRCSFANGRVTEQLGYESEDVCDPEADFFAKVLSGDDYATFLDRCGSLGSRAEESEVEATLRMTTRRREWREFAAKLMLLSSDPDGSPKTILVSAI